MLQKSDFGAVWDLFLSKNMVKVKDEKGHPKQEIPTNFLGSVNAYKRTFDQAVQEYVNNVNRITDNPRDDLV